MDNFLLLAILLCHFGSTLASMRIDPFEIDGENVDRFSPLLTNADDCPSSGLFEVEVILLCHPLAHSGTLCHSGLSTLFLFPDGLLLFPLHPLLNQSLDLFFCLSPPFLVLSPRLCWCQAHLALPLLLLTPSELLGNVVVVKRICIGGIIERLGRFCPLLCFVFSISVTLFGAFLCLFADRSFL